MKKTEKTEEILKEFYKKKRTQNKLEYEIEILRKSNQEMKEVLEREFKSDLIIARINKNENIMVEKQLKVNELRSQIAATEFIIDSLSDEERAIIEMRYKYKRDYQTIVDDLNLSKSTIARRISNIVDILEDELEI